MFQTSAVRENPRVSEQLVDRHPYYPTDPVNVATFSSEIKQDQVTIAFGSRKGPKLISALKLNDLSDEKRIEALHLVLDAVQDQRGRSIQVNNGLVEACTALLENQNKTIQKLSMDVLAKISTTSSGRTLIDSCNAPATIAHILINESKPELQMHCAFFFKQLAFCKDGVSTILNSPDTFERILSTFKTKVSKLKCTQEAFQVQTMFNLLSCIQDVTKHPSGVDLLLENDSMPSVVKTFNVVKEKETMLRVQQLATVVVANAAYCTKGKRVAIQTDAITVLAQILNSKSVDVRRGGINALHLLSVEKLGKLRFAEQSVVHSMVNALSDTVSFVRNETVKTINLACESNEVLLVYIKELVLTNKLFSFVFEDCPRITQVLIDLLHPNTDNSILECVVFKIWQLISLEDGASILMNCVYPIEKMYTVLVDSQIDPEVTEYLIQILVELSAKRPRAMKTCIEESKKYKDQSKYHPNYRVAESIQDMLLLDQTPESKS